MLARKNRLVTADDYRSTVRRGRRLSSPHAVAYVLATPSSADTRVGFIVAKTVGNAVSRNRVRRRLKSIAHNLIIQSEPELVLPTRSFNIVIRALPGAAQADWVTLEDEVSTLLNAHGSALAGSTSRTQRTAPTSVSAEPDTDTRSAVK